MASADRTGMRARRGKRRIEAMTSRIARRRPARSSEALTMIVLPSADASASTPGGSSSVCTILVIPAPLAAGWLAGRPCLAGGGGLVIPASVRGR